MACREERTPIGSKSHCMSEDLVNLIGQKCARLLAEKKELRTALEELLTKPACSSCIRQAQEALAKIKPE